MKQIIWSGWHYKVASDKYLCIKILCFFKMRFLLFYSLNKSSLSELNLSVRDLLFPTPQRPVYTRCQVLLLSRLFCPWPLSPPSPLFSLSFMLHWLNLLDSWLLVHLLSSSRLMPCTGIDHSKSIFLSGKSS